MKIKSLNRSSSIIFLVLFCFQLTTGNSHFLENNPVNLPATLMPPPPSFSYANPLCKNGPPIVLPTTFANFTPGGFFFSSPAGLFISNTASGQINVTNSTPGTYTVTYSLDMSTATVVVAPQISPQILPANVSMCQGNSVSLTVTPLSAMGYTWSTGSNANPLTVSPNVSTNYMVTLKDSYGCVYTTQRLVNVTSAPANLSVNNPTLCAGLSTTIGLTSGTVTPGTTFLWQPGSYPFQTANVSPTVTTVYTLNVNSSGCTKTLTAKVTVSPATTPTVTFNYPYPICTDGIDPFPIKDPGFTEGGTFFSTDMENFPIDSVTGKIRLAELATGTYLISYSIAAQGCRPADVGYSSITPSEVSYITYSPDIEITEGSGTILFASGATEYLWEPGTGLNCNDCPNPYALPTQTTKYCISDPTNGCAKGGCVTISVVCLNTGDMSVPSAFTPNKDGRNEKFCLKGWTYCVTDFNIKIFNRWGQMVYETNNPEFCWDGTLNGQDLSSGVYVYAIEANVNREKYSKKGNITIIR